MARAALDLGVKDLAELAGVGVNTVSRFENGAEALISTATALQSALEKKGIEFIPENGGGAGVRLAKKAKK